MSKATAKVPEPIGRSVAFRKEGRLLTGVIFATALVDGVGHASSYHVRIITDGGESVMEQRVVRQVSAKDVAKALALWEEVKPPEAAARLDMAMTIAMTQSAKSARISNLIRLLGLSEKLTGTDQPPRLALTHAATLDVSKDGEKRTVELTDRSLQVLVVRDGDDGPYYVTLIVSWRVFQHVHKHAISTGMFEFVGKLSLLAKKSAAG